MIQASFALGAALLLCGCAGGPAGGGPVARLEADARVFISPSGEPFRRAGGGSPLAAWFGAADLDRTGDLDEAEFRADAERFYGVLDADADGVISNPEIQAYEARVAPEILPDFGVRPQLDEARGEDGVIRLPGRLPERDDRLSGGPGDRPGGRRPGRGSGVLSLLQDPQPVTRADYDQSGSVTRAERLRATAERFRRLDLAGDGRLSLAELRTIRIAPEPRTRKRDLED